MARPPEPGAAAGWGTSPTSRAPRCRAIRRVSHHLSERCVRVPCRPWEIGSCFFHAAGQRFGRVATMHGIELGDIDARAPGWSHPVSAAGSGAGISFRHRNEMRMFVLSWHAEYCDKLPETGRDAPASPYSVKRLWRAWSSQHGGGHAVTGQANFRSPRARQDGPSRRAMPLPLAVREPARRGSVRGGPVPPWLPLAGEMTAGAAEFLSRTGTLEPGSGFLFQGCLRRAAARSVPRRDLPPLGKCRADRKHRSPPGPPQGDR